MPSKKKYVPNSVLPKGATMLRRLRTAQVGNWSESLKYDAKIVLLGITWWRVNGGFSDNRNHPSENWCAEIPSGCLCVSNDDWDGSHPFGYEHHTLYRSFYAAVNGETTKFLKECWQSYKETLAKTRVRFRTVKVIRAAIQRIK